MVNDQLPNGIEACLRRLRLPEPQIERAARIFQLRATFDDVRLHDGHGSKRSLLAGRALVGCPVSLPVASGTLAGRREESARPAGRFEARSEELFSRSHPLPRPEGNEVERILVRILDDLWYGPRAWGRMLAPLSLPYAGAVRLRRALFRRGLRASHRIAAPVVVVGNIAVGGTGKTPLVVWIVGCLRNHGYRPGVLCSGYRGGARDWPQAVHERSNPAAVGDEAVLIAKRCGCPVAAGPDRVAAARSLLDRSDCDILVSDDGLQHYRLARDVEIAVLDGQRRHGTGWCIPAGPLREPVSRLESVDFVVAKGGARTGEYRMELTGRRLRLAADDSITIDPMDLGTGPVHAVAGIGNPASFFGRLRDLGLRIVPRAFPDHHPYSPGDLEFPDERPVIMTEKDALKCRGFAGARHWYLPVDAKVDAALESALIDRLSGIA